MSNGEPENSGLTILDLVQAPLQDRRSFIRTLALGGLTVTVGGLLFTRRAVGAEEDKGPNISMILVDFNKCTGCRTCETVCAQFNHKVTVDGEEVLGLGNPYLANIRVYPFNPDADVPIVCVMCGDNPCIEACPVEPDGSGRRALYREPSTMAVRNDPERCLACGKCAEACRTKRVGAIISNRETHRPERMCTLCGGKPQCVQYCPFDALDHVEGELDGRHYGLPPERIADELIRRWYGRTLQKGGAGK